MWTRDVWLERETSCCAGRARKIFPSVHPACRTPLIPLAAVYTAGRRNWRTPVMSSYVLWAQLPCLSCRSVRPSVCRDGERGNLLFPKDTPRGRRHADKRGRERGERRASIFLACSRAIAEIRAFSRSSFLPSESLPRGIERPPSLLPSFHIALMV